MDRPTMKHFLSVFSHGFQLNTPAQLKRDCGHLRNSTFYELFIRPMHKKTCEAFISLRKTR